MIRNFRGRYSYSIERSVRTLLSRIMGRHYESFSRRAFEDTGFFSSIIDVMRDAAIETVIKEGGCFNASFEMLPAGNFQVNFDYDPDGNGETLPLGIRMGATMDSPDSWKSELLDGRGAVIASSVIQVPVTGIGNEFGLSKQIKMAVSRCVRAVRPAMEDAYTDAFKDRYADMYSMAESRRMRLIRHGSLLNNRKRR